ncbi:hypothetical protein CVT24_010725 [Panaeolus cyanescens]|uniref:HNH nuclease domain-containing protein n=1 Tax=Panaeolus cyanescens TaxID=181874 RepID=A0A409YW06_9AGAR|nr:hypothetical protein CVT24_010725 [Panaeolus cyanescens]
MEISVKPTPNERIGIISTVTVVVKCKLVRRSVLIGKRVQITAPSSNRCIVTNRRNPGGVSIHVCHAFGRALSLNDDIMSSVEYNWGMIVNTLNLDTRYNCFFCDSVFHAMFDNGSWCLMPERRVLTRYESAMMKDGPQHGAILAAEMSKDDDKVHKYTLVCLNPTRLKNTPIHLCDNKKLDRDGSQTTKKLAFPFTDLPKIRSHLHPKFVILSLGYQLLRTKHIPASALDQPHLAQYDVDFTAVTSLADRWLQKLTDKEKSDPEFNKKASRTNGKTSTHMVLRSQSNNDLRGTAAKGSKGKTLRKATTTVDLKKAAARGRTGAGKAKNTKRIEYVEDNGEEDDEEELDEINYEDFNPSHIPDTDDEEDDSRDDDRKTAWVAYRATRKRAAGRSLDRVTPPPSQSSRTHSTQAPSIHAESSTQASTSAAAESLVRRSKRLRIERE